MNDVPFAGSTLITWQAKFSELVPLVPLPPPLTLPLLTAVKVGKTRLVGVERIKITVAVYVGEGVIVFAGVDVGVSVGVDVGMAALVCVAAAFTVSAMNILIWFGSTVGTGAPMVGTQANTNARAENHSRKFNFRVAILPLPRPEKTGRQ